MTKAFKFIGILFLVLIATYAVGPRVTFDKIDFNKSNNPFPINQLDEIVASNEAKILNIKPNNEAKIVWADSTKSKTEYSLLYLHGFSASHEEGSPLHTNFGKRYGCNVYLSRLYDHGRLDSNSLKELTPDRFYKSAEDAYIIAKSLGQKVIIMSCSTGGTLDILLSQKYPEIYGHIMYSPNISIADPTAKLMTLPWGAQILEMVMGGEINHVTYKDAAKPYWLESYHSDGIIAMQTVLDDYMDEEHFKKINQPLFIGAYYKDEEHQDNVVSVAAMRDFYNKISTPVEKKRYIEFPNAGRHVISSHIFSEDLKGVEIATYDFAEQVLGLKPISN